MVRAIAAHIFVKDESAVSTVAAREVITFVAVPSGTRDGGTIQTAKGAILGGTTPQFLLDI